MLCLFADMNCAWGCKWTAHLENAENTNRVLDLWTRSFCDLSDNEIIAAFEYLKNTEEFPPSIAKFRRSALGIVSKAQAFELAKDEGHQLHKVLPSWDWKNLSESETRRRFTSKYMLHEDEMLNRCNAFEINEAGQLTHKIKNLLTLSHSVV